MNTTRGVAGMLRKWIAICVLAVPALSGAVMAETRDAPAAHCVDGRALAEVYQADDTTLAIRGGDGRRHLVTLGESCPGILEGAGAQVVGWSGWVCGAAGEMVRSGTRSCPISGTSVIDTRTYAALLKQAHADMPTLETVVVRSARQRGFRGTPDYCVANSWLRGWHETPEGIVVEVSPRRSGGHRFYRIETRGACSMQSGSESLSLASVMGLGMVCGNPGDHVVFSRSNTGAVAGLDTFHGAVSPFGARCEVSQVYPLER